MKRKTPVLIATAALAALAACGGEPTPTPTPPPTPEASVSATPTPTPSPTPTGPVRFPDDPNWTANQLAAVQTVDRYHDVTAVMMRDPVNADFGPLIKVAAEPLYSYDVNVIQQWANQNMRLTGGVVTPVTRDVGAEATVDGRQEIKVVQCEVDAPDAKGYKGDVEVDLGSPRMLYEFAVQWVEKEAGWRVVDRTKVSESC